MAFGRSKTSTIPVSTLTAKYESLTAEAAASAQAAQDFVAAASQANTEAQRAANQAIAVDKAYQVLADAGVTTL
jgi:hypothetical protein